MPEMESDAHLGPELASNPDDDMYSDIEAEKRRNMQDAKDLDSQLIYPYGSSHYGIHSREQSLAQLQHDIDNPDPIDNSAISMLLAGEGLGGMKDECLSEDGRTNDSDITTNPSAPASPIINKFPGTISHGHQMSNSSNVWAAEQKAAAAAASKPKLPKL